ncbi:hypothetical protein BC829DRAFT_396690 [Chytridium lagenaria]|nr:hypothetical protein BC829DRAFT_396690 [Chytridium lagenaria]
MAVFLWGLVNGIILLNSAPPRAKKTGKSVHAYLKIVTLLSLLSGMISITINKALKHPRIPSTPHNLVDDETPEASVSSASAFFETHYRSLHGLLGALCLLICLSIGFIGMFHHSRSYHLRKMGPRVFPNPIVRYTLSIIMVIVWALVVLLARPAPVSNADKGIVRYLRRGATKISATSGGKTSRAVKAPCECSRCFGLSEVREGVVAVSPENHVRSEGEQVIVTIDGNDAANP